jgi:hypothetical protein
VTTTVPVPASRRDTTRPPGRLLRVVVYSAGALVAAALIATLIVVAINGNFWGLLTVPAGMVVGVILWYVGELLEARRKRAVGY